MNTKDKSLEPAPLQAYGKGQLANMYYPDCTDSWARRLFNKDLQRVPGLTEELRRRGWSPQMRLLRKDWVRLIFDAIEPP